MHYPSLGPLKELAKRVFNAVGLVLSLPFILWALMPPKGRRCYSHAAYFLSIMPGFLGLMMRRAFYCILLPECRWDLHVGFGSVITQPTTRIGRRLWMGAYCLVGRSRIGDDVVLASRVSVLSGRRQHRFDSLERPISAQGGEYQEVVIGDDSWLGEGSIIMADVGRKCVVGAGSVLVEPVHDCWIVAGNPARQIGERGASPGPNS